MAGSVNKVILVGNLGRDPEVRFTNDGMKIANFSIATSESWKDKATGERRERTEWHRIVIMNDRLSEICEQYIRKGTKVYVEGQLQTRKWTDQEGRERYTTEILISRFKGELTILDSRASVGENPAPNPSASMGAPLDTAPLGSPATPMAAPAAKSLQEDDIPF